MTKTLTKSKALLAAFALALAAVLAVALVGCSSGEEEGTSGSEEGTTTEASESTDEEDTTITVAASPTPHAEILNDVVAPLLEEEGYTLEVIEYTDYVQPDTVVAEGEVDANFFQHTPYMENFNEENGTDLVAVVSVHFEPFGLYPGKTASLDELEEGAVVAVPNDATNEARALLLLEEAGLLTLDEDAGIEATTNDIVDNPLNLQFEELEAATIANVIADVDIACINGNYALDAGFSIDDALLVESADSLAAETYANVLAVNSGNEDSEKIQALADALTSEEVREYIDETYEGAVEAVF